MLELGRAKPEVLDVFCQLHVINAIQGFGVEHSAIYERESIGAQILENAKCCPGKNSRLLLENKRRLCHVEPPLNMAKVYSIYFFKSRSRSFACSKTSSSLQTANRSQSSPM